ncbi:MAG: hypothetical protein A2Y74_00090 [Actinobacteria bacterium RBG_13_63_9]|jgi:hypothetical protein|nr:MAG: hypothetical protein A2Y74_00090 [Actinobacteria bacterium RBG_13_63_9]
MATLLDAASIEEIQARMQRLQPDAPALWGRMSASQMVCHLIDAFRIPLGEEPVTVRWTPLRICPLRWLLVYMLPWPKGKLPTTPEFQRTQPTTWAADQVAWRAALERFVERGRKGGPFGPHPAFGALSTREWGRLAYLHCDHHLRQFGV